MSCFDSSRKTLARHAREFHLLSGERFFAAMDDILAAVDERDLRAVPGYHFEKVPNICEGCYSLRLGKQFRLVLRMISLEGENGIEIIDVLDYH